jgi:SAM-dependent methyltransferase
MAQVNTGVYAFLNRPALFNAVQRLIHNGNARRLLVDLYTRPDSGHHVLDIGCGTGSMLPYLGDVDYVGIDPEPTYIDLARAQHGSRGSFVHTGIEEIGDVYNGSFDRVIAVGVLHHLDDAAAAALFRVAARALKPGGRLVTCDPVWRTPQNPFARLVIGLDRGKSVRTQDGYRALAHASFDRVEVTLRSDLMRIPYDHCVLVCSDPTSAAG